MYFLLGWPHTLRTIKVPRSRIVSVRCNRDRVLLAVLYENAIELWHYKPCVPIVCHQIPGNLATLYGVFRFVEWRPDSSSVVIVTEHGYLLFFDLRVKEGHHAYSQVDSSRPGLRRESAELYSKEEIPAIQLHLRSSVLISGSVSCGTSMRDELMVATQTAQIQRLSWEGEINRDYCVDLRRVPFCTDKQVAIAIPLTDTGVFVTAIDYSPLLPGFSIVLNDGRAAFLAASSFKFDPNSVQGIWATQLSDATCTALNHKYRLIAFGKRNSDCVVYCIDDLTGGLTVSHVLHLSERAYSGPPSPVTELHWTPDGSAVAVTWANGGLGLWSVFGSLLMCSLSWDERGLFVSSMDWGPEGYTLWMVTVEAQPLENGASPVCSCSAPPAFPNHNAIGLLAPAMPQPPLPSPSSPLGPPPLRHSSCDKKPVAWTYSLKQYHLVKSALTVNPAMCYQERLFLQGEDRLYINANEPRCVTTPAPGTGASRRPRHFSTGDDLTPPSSRNPSAASETDNGSAHLANQIGNKQWFTITIPSTYSSTNWPIRYTALDSEAVFVAVAGRYGFAHYSLTNRKWKLFGSEAQERDFIVTGGMVWWRGFVVLGCYNLAKLQDEVRLYPQAAKLDNVHALITRLESQVLLLSLLGDVLGIYEADNTLLLFQLGLAKDREVSLIPTQRVNLLNLVYHPACVSSIALTSLRADHSTPRPRDSDGIAGVLLNICGRLILLQLETLDAASGRIHQALPTVLATNVENVWLPLRFERSKRHLTEALWIHCGNLGMRVWLPLFPQHGGKAFMAKRIMIPVSMSIYPLAILFEAAVVLGVESDSLLYPPHSGEDSERRTPFLVLERTSEVYLPHVLRQLLRRNLGHSAFAIARSCSSLPYFPHALELLLHSVLEDEATSKEPLPDALLPSVVDFIQEFPIYLQTIVRCARKSEILLWNHLFSYAGNPRDLTSQCINKGLLDTAANYLVILQNLERADVSRSYATLLLDSCLQNSRWSLAKDIIRYLRAIDPEEVQSPRPNPTGSVSKWASLQTGPASPVAQVSPNVEDLSLVLGTIPVPRGRSMSTTSAPHGSLKRVASGGSGVQPPPSAVTAGAGNQGQPTSASQPSRKGSIPNKKDDQDGFLVDSLLQQHARRLLSEGSLRSLGFMAAHLDFPLVSFFQAEKERSARVTDFVGSLQGLHSDFAWPLPILVHPISHYRLDSTYDPDESHSLSSPRSGRKGSQSTYNSIQKDAVPHSPSNDSFDFEPPSPAPLTVDTALAQSVKPGPSDRIPNEDPFDSGFASASHPPVFQTVTAGAHGQTDGLSPVVVEAQLRPYPLQLTSGLSHVESEQEDLSLMSDLDSVAGGGPESLSGSSGQPRPPSLAPLERLSQEMANKGPHEAEVQLRYLLQLLQEGGCLDWSLLLSLVLRDAMAVLRTLNAARSFDVSPETLVRLRKGLKELEIWTETECPGYRPLLIALQNQLVFYLQPRPPPSSSTSSSSTKPSSTASREPGRPKDNFIETRPPRRAKGTSSSTSSSQEGTVDGDSTSPPQLSPSRRRVPGRAVSFSSLGGPGDSPFVVGRDRRRRRSTSPPPAAPQEDTPWLCSLQ